MFLPFMNQVMLWLISDAGADMLSRRVFTPLPYWTCRGTFQPNVSSQESDHLNNLCFSPFQLTSPRLLRQHLDRPSPSHQWASSLCHPWRPSHRLRWSRLWPLWPPPWSQTPPTPPLSSPPAPSVWTSLRMKASPHPAPAGGASLASFLIENLQWGIMTVKCSDTGIGYWYRCWGWVLIPIKFVPIPQHWFQYVHDNFEHLEEKIKVIL